MPVTLKYSVQEIILKNGLMVGETLPPERMQDASLGATLSGNMNVDLDFSVGGETILLTGKIRGSWDLACARCLSEFRARYAARLEETYPLDLDEIDCEGEIREALTLAVPVKALCRPDCRGLCAECGVNLNEQPEHKHGVAPDTRKG
jgi:uncharacterized protein